LIRDGKTYFNKIISDNPSSIPCHGSERLSIGKKKMPPKKTSTKTVKSQPASLLSESAILFDRLPPSSREAENGVIGAILLNPKLCDELVLMLRPDDFFYDANRKIYRHLLSMCNEVAGIDLTLLVERLRQAGELEEIGGEAYLGELMSSVQVTAHAVHYAKIVQNQAVRRELINTSSEILRNAYEPGIAPRELVSQAEEKIFAINDSRNNSQVHNMNEVMKDVFQLIDARTSGDLNGVRTGFYELDKLLGGLHGSELIILAARPSMGKTALATNIADYVAVEQQQPVLFFSLEMAKVELALRMICARGKIKGEQLRGNYMNEKLTNIFTRVTSKLSSVPIYIDDSPSRTVTEIGAVARRIKRQEGLGLIIIDYLGLIEPDNPLDPRQEQVAKIARRLKGLARELDTPVLCLAQLNRMAEATKDNKPRLSHLRESGAIEQDADVVMFVHREEYYLSREKAEEKGLLGVAEVIVAKQRNGPIGTVRLAWLGQYTLFANYATNDEQESYQEFQNDFPDGSDSFYNEGF